MEIQRDGDVQTFRDLASPLLYANEAEYGLMLGLVEGLCSGLKAEGEPLFIRIVENGATTAALVQTRPDNAILTALTPKQAEALAQFCLASNLKMLGAVGPEPGVQTFCRAYSRRPTEVRMQNRILALRQVQAPRPVGGELRLAVPGDASIVREYIEAFYDECLPLEKPPLPKIQQLAEQVIARGECYLWWENGKPISMAHTGRPTKHGVSVKMVYTPPSQRGRGLASNVTAEISRRMLASGKTFCVLYTDVQNPTSNKVYESVGYQEVGTSTFLTFAL